MKQQISLREANQHLSEYIEAVSRGDEVIITRRGKPVAKLVPIEEERHVAPEQQAAWERLKASARPLNVGRFVRDECYDHLK
ncbi:MAG: type II toxin-antitoxin system Phd/YefM family antitoxin [Pseudomonadota bacterium]